MHAIAPFTVLGATAKDFPPFRLPLWLKWALSGASQQVCGLLKCNGALMEGHRW